MTAPPRVDERPHFQRWFWRVQRAGWAAMPLLVGAALVGLTGGGGIWSELPVSRDGAVVTYPRVMRIGTAATLTVATDARAGSVVVTLGSDLLSDFALTAFVPEPAGMAAAPGGGVAATFDAAGDAVIRLGLTPRSAGRRAHAIGVDGREISVAPLVLP